MAQRQHSNENEINTEGSSSGFTLPMAFMDMLPVIFFSVSIAVLSSRFSSRLFLAGAVFVILAGAMKVLWKFLLAAAKRDIRFFNRQMRFLMPAGFILIIIALIADRRGWSPGNIVAHVLSIPAVFFFILAAAGVMGMIYFTRHFDQMDARANWIEQGTNALAQFFFMMGILL